MDGPQPRLPIRKDPARLSIPAARALSVIARGRLICEHTHDERFPSGRRFIALPSGASITDEDASELIAKGKVSPMADGLFGADCSQTWVAS